MSAVLSAVFGAGTQLFSSQGAVLAGGKIYTYVAGTTTPAPTFTDSTQLVPNANPIILDSAGRTTSEIWLTNGSTYKFVVTDLNNNAIGPTLDNIPGINQSTTALSEWVSAPTPSYVSGTQFSVPGNQTSVFVAARRVQYQLTAGTYYGSVSASTYDGVSTTTITIVADSTALNSTLSAVNYGFINSNPSSIPVVSGITASYVQAQTGVAFTTAGTTSAYTLTPSPSVAGNVANQEWDITFNSTCSASPTISVNGNTAMALVKYAGGVYTALTAGDVVNGWRSKVTVLSGGTQALVRSVVNPNFGTLTATSIALSTPLPVAQGGTGASTLTVNNVLLGNGTSAPQVVAPGTAGNVLTSNGTTWASTATPVGGSSTNTQVLYNSSGSVVGSANLTFDGTKLSSNGIPISQGASNSSASIAIGVNALGSSTSGNAVAIGSNACRNLTTGSVNTAVGVNSLFSGTTAYGNTCIGYNAGYDITGSGNVVIGGPTSTIADSPVFVITGQSNRISMGSTGVLNAYIQVAWTVVSDVRDKTDFAPVPHGLDFVCRLNPTAYRYKASREDTQGQGPVRYGFKAQDVLALEGDTPVIVDAEDLEKLRFNDQSMIAVLVNAIKELKAEFDAYKAGHP